MSARLESDQYMHVVPRKVLCGFCARRRAMYDVSAANNGLGFAGDWYPSCGSCARRFRERLKQAEQRRQEAK
jgi:hypothetical protein